jgi:hypothetical protein
MDREGRRVKTNGHVAGTAALVQLLSAAAPPATYNHADELIVGAL